MLMQAIAHEGVRTVGSLTCAQMLVHAIAHGGIRTPEESLR